MDSKKADLKQCPVCNGTGKTVAGYGVICMEIIEGAEKCPACNGIASWSQIAALKGDLTLF